MRAEIIGVGTELLLGEVVNTNAAFIARELAALGIACHNMQVVGDNPARLRAALDIALSRSDLVITTGGLGPTKDDLTKETIADALGVPLEFHQPSWDHVLNRLAARGRTPEPSHRREAMMPIGARVFPNPQGTANALAITTAKTVPQKEAASSQTVIMLPGPPREMAAVFQDEIAPCLSAQSEGTIVSHNLHFLGIGESQLEAQLPPGLLEASNPTTALYAGTGEVRIRLSARAATEQEAEDLIAPIANQLKDQFQDYLYSTDLDLQTALVQTLKEKQLTIATAESCTGGRIAAKITAVAGSSDVFGYGVVSYANSAKMEVLGVRPETLAQFGAVSEETAIEMAEGVKNLSGADIGIGVTGIAGPDGGSVTKPIGLVWVGIAGANGVAAKQLNLGRGLAEQRELIQELATTHALNLALRAARDL
ncbi:MAG: competence/damage-inducible protein A [Cellulomonadaceae bacterium]|jgi:nicotinamide-nucleotide amidase|nr:competence/damage-inducible protein A [Cellulomonadaceae bacterium]